MLLLPGGLGVLIVLSSHLCTVAVCIAYIHYYMYIGYALYNNIDIYILLYPHIGELG